MTVKYEYENWLSSDELEENNEILESIIGVREEASFIFYRNRPEIPLPEYNSWRLLRHEVDEEFNTFTPIEQNFLQLYFGLEDGWCMTIGEISKLCNIPRKSIYQILAGAIYKLTYNLI